MGPLGSLPNSAIECIVILLGTCNPGVIPREITCQRFRRTAAIRAGLQLLRGARYSHDPTQLRDAEQVMMFYRIKVTIIDTLDKDMRGRSQLLRDRDVQLGYIEAHGRWLRSRAALRDRGLLGEPDSEDEAPPRRYPFYEEIGVRSPSSSAELSSGISEADNDS